MFFLVGVSYWGSSPSFLFLQQKLIYKSCRALVSIAKWKSPAVPSLQKIFWLSIEYTHATDISSSSPN